MQGHRWKSCGFDQTIKTPQYGYFHKKVSPELDSYILQNYYRAKCVTLTTSEETLLSKFDHADESDIQTFPRGNRNSFQEQNGIPSVWRSATCPGG